MDHNQIRVDQSHCNYHLSQFLSKIGWSVLFTDAGRVSRGGTGTQGIILKIFEETGLPIPDIVAVSGQHLLLIEIDLSFSKAANSLLTYKNNEALILNRIGSRIAEIEKLCFLNTGFCKIGITKKPALFFRNRTTVSKDIDLLIAFTEPEQPLLIWTKQNDVER